MVRLRSREPDPLACWVGEKRQARWVGGPPQVKGVPTSVASKVADRGFRLTGAFQGVARAISKLTAKVPL